MRTQQEALVSAVEAFDTEMLFGSGVAPPQQLADFSDERQGEASYQQPCLGDPLATSLDRQLELLRGTVREHEAAMMNCATKVWVEKWMEVLQTVMVDSVTFNCVDGGRAAAE